MTTLNRFSIGEIYHCYNRGVDKRTTFNGYNDYERFIELLFLCNNKDLKQRSNVGKISHADIFNIQRAGQIVSIGAWVLMPNHFHLLLQEITAGGISTFMGRVGNSYTKYFNIKNDRNGNLFIKPFNSKHITEDNHFSHITEYIHLNPAELFETRWKDGIISNPTKLENSLKKYPYSSLPDYFGIDRLEKQILNKEFIESLNKDSLSLKEVIENVNSLYTDPSGQYRENLIY